VYPRIAALAELGWSPADTRDWNAFLQRMPAELARYRALGIGYADTAFAPAFNVTAAREGMLRVVLSSQTNLGTIRYSTDGSAPVATSTAYTHPLEFSAQDEVTLRAATFASSGFELAAPRTRVLDAATLLRRGGNELASCSDQPGMRLGGPLPAQGPGPVYRVDVGDMCWVWSQAPLAGVKHVVVTVGRVAWRFGDEARDAVIRPKRNAAGEIELHADSCTGPLLATLSLTPATQMEGETRLHADISTPEGDGVRNLCIFATGDPRGGQWTLARVEVSK
jgi:hexosaminidase